MYCVKCGVELADSEKKCPLCGTAVFHPELSREDAEKPFPEYRRNESEIVNRSGVLFIITVILAITVVGLLLVDWRISGGPMWSGYAGGGIVLAYIAIVLPFWFRSPNPVILLAADFITAALYLLYINFSVGGSWFWSFALPVIACGGLLVCSVTALVRYVKRGYLFIFGGALILGGALMVLLEHLINLTFHVREVFFWSFFPLAGSSIMGLTLIIIGLCPSLHESLRQKFFL